MSPDNLIGVDPNDTTDVQYGGATFTVGVVPAGAWEILEARHALAQQRATRRVIKDLHSQGVDPEEVAQKFPTKEGQAEVVLTRADIAVMSDPTFLQETQGIYADAVRLAVRGHKGFVNRYGVPFEFKTTEAGEVHADVMKVYQANGRLMRALWLNIRALNDMGVLAKKV